MTTTVLITAIGSFSADIVIKNLKKSGFRTIGCDIYPREWIVDSGNVEIFYQAPLATDSSRYVEFLLEVCRREGVSFLLPLTDAEIDVLNRHREVFSNAGVCICISAYDTIAICRDKLETERFLRERNACRLIPSFPARGFVPADSSAPFICKPRDGRSSQGLCRVCGSREWEAFQKRPDLDNYMVQPYIGGPVITADVVRNSRTGRAAVLPRRELLRTPNGAGTSVYVFENQELEDTCAKIAEILDINGCVNFEFIEDGEGERYFIECNPRFSGGVEFTCIAGYDCVKNHMRCFSDQEIETRPPVRSQFIARKFEEYVTKVE